MSTAGQIGQRIIQIPLVMLVVSAVVFVLVQVVPGDPGRNALGPYASAEQVVEWNAAHGLAGTVVERYLSWLGDFFIGNWGTSLVYGESVFGLVLERLVNSIVLGLMAFVIMVPLAVAIAVLQARREGSRVDRATTIALITLASIPEFVIGVVLLISFALVLPILPLQSGEGLGSGLLPHLASLTLPAVTLALGIMSVVARTARTSIVEATGSPHYRTAVVKGLGPGTLLTQHVARNAVIPTIATLGLFFGAFLGGSAVVETLFGYPGLGELLVTATQRKDDAVLVAGVVVTGFISLLALLVTDVIFTLVDPRVSLAGTK